MPQGSSHPDTAGRAHRIAMLVDAGSNPFEMGIATELFGLRRPELDIAWYDFTLCAPANGGTPANEGVAGGGGVRMHDGFFTLSGVPGLAAADAADTVIVPNRPDDTPPTAAVVAAIRRAADRGARLVSFCTGAYALAAAGVLDGRPAAIHWRWADRFAARHPAVRVRRDVLFVDDGDVLTAAGSAAALDLGLHLIRRDHGAEVANHVSRRLVFAAHRDGGQRQFIERPVPAVPDASLAPVLAWAAARLDRPLTVADLAGQAAVSPATLHRRFVRELGTTPLAWLTGERVALACRLIERGEHRLEVVARTSGLGTAANLRTQVRRRTGLSPSAYRARFGPAGAAGAAGAGGGPGLGPGPGPAPDPGPVPVPENGSGSAPRPC
ncbi:helix-turn-helix domain-containing protein [Streptomyces aculeolatus]|uniref:helix-turn-helix domain-containing protein n=1 Tax=Streptomyces aculeolatus TaxID=270689 RepID=UPI001CEDC268|nr:helix-turn-helix domain-containing protein [Streptomyces aculeolatus]